MPPSRFGQVSRYRNATFTPAKAHERFSELGLGAFPDNCGGRLLAVTPVSGHVFARSGNGSNALIILAPGSPRKYAKQPPTLQGACQGTLADFDLARFQENENTAMIAAGSAQGSLTIKTVTLPANEEERTSIKSEEEVVMPQAVGGAPVTAVKFHPTSAPIVAAASNAGNHLRVYNATRFQAQAANAVLEWDAGIPQWDIAWSADGSQCAGAGKDLLVRIWDARQTKVAIDFAAHASKVKPTKVTFITESASHLLLTTGFSQMRQREIAIWDQRKSTSPLKRIILDVASSSLDPVCEHDRGIVYMTAKGDSNIRWIDVGSQDQGSNFAEGAYPVDFSAASAALGPASSVESGKGEIAQLLVATASGSGGASSSDAIVPCSVQVPRRNYIDFHAELYPDTPDRSGKGIAPDTWLQGSNDAVSRLSMDPNARKHAQPSSTLPSRTSSADERQHSIATSEISLPSGKSMHGDSLPLEVSPQETQTRQKAAPAFNGGSTPTMSTEQSAPSSALSNRASKITSMFRTPAIKAHWSRKPLAGATPLIPAHQNLSGLDISRGPDARMIAVSRRFVFLPISGPGGRLGVHAIHIHGRLPLHLPSFVHGSPLVDFAADPFNDDQILSIAQDGVVRLWRVPPLTKDKDDNEEISPLDNEKPVSTVPLHGVSKIAGLTPHPLVGALVAVLPSDASGQLSLVDVSTSEIVASLSLPGDGVFAAAWSPDGSVLAIAGKDKQLRIVDVRASSADAKVLGSIAAHDSTRSFNILWLDDRHLLTVGHTVGSMRQLKVYSIDQSTAELSAVAKQNLDASPSVLFPVWDADTSICWLWSKGERIVAAYEIQPSEKEVFTVLPSFQLSQPQLGLDFLPKDCVDVRKVELGKALRLSKTELQHVAWNVPRSRPEYFQDDIYSPAAVVRQPLLDTQTWMRGRDVGPIPRENLQPNDMTALSQAPPAQAKQSSLSKGPTMRQLTEKEREDQALQSVFEKAKRSDEGRDPNHNEDQAARAPDDEDWDSD